MLPHAAPPLAPDAPLVVDGFVLPGNASLMLRCMVEELLQGGLTPGAIREMADNENYQALHAARCMLGPAEFERVMAQAAACTGVHRVRMRESAAAEAEAELTVRGVRPDASIVATRFHGDDRHG
jgi:hypothetical protein